MRTSNSTEIARFYVWVRISYKLHVHTVVFIKAVLFIKMGIQKRKLSQICVSLPFTYNNNYSSSLSLVFCRETGV